MSFPMAGLTLGLGAGNYPDEFRVFGADLAERAQAMDEGVTFIKAGLSGGLLPDGPGSTCRRAASRPVGTRRHAPAAWSVPHGTRMVISATPTSPRSANCPGSTAR